MSVVVSKTLKARNLGFGFLRSASLFQQDATPTLTLTNRPQTSKI